MKSWTLVVFAMLTLLPAQEQGVGQATGGTPASNRQDSPTELPSSSAIRTRLIPGDSPGILGCPCYSPDSKLIAAQNTEGIKVFDTRTGRLLISFDPKDRGPIFAPRGNTLAATIGPGDWALFDPSTGRMLRAFDTHPGLTIRNGCNSVAFSRDGKKLAASYDTGEAVIWDVDSGKRLRVLPPYIIPASGTPPASPTNPVYPARPARIHALAFSPDGSTLYTAGHILRAWDLAETVEARVFDLPEKFPCYTLALSADGATIAATSGSRGPYVESRSIFLLDSKTGRKKAEITSNQDVMDIAFRPGGRELVSLEGYRVIRLWDAATAKPIAACRFEKHFRLNQLAVSPDGKLIAATGQDSAPIFGVIGMVKTDGPTLGPWLPEP